MLFVHAYVDFFYLGSWLVPLVLRVLACVPGVYRGIVLWYGVGPEDLLLLIVRGPVRVVVWVPVVVCLVWPFDKRVVVLVVPL